MAELLLAGLIVVPGIGTLIAACSKRRPDIAGVAGVVSALVSLVLALGLLALAPPWRQGADAASIDIGWIGLLGSRLRLGWDGISAPLILLASLLSALACWYLLAGTDDGHDTAADDGTQRPPPPGLVACVLATQTAATATFAARDLLVFFVAFEAVLIPMWVLIGRWGAAGRRAAATRFVLYTALGSAVMMLGIVLLAMAAGTTDFGRLAAAGPHLPPSTQAIAAALLLVGFGVKLPAWPLHAWLPPAHTVAPTVGSVLLAGVLLKLGSYGMVRLVAGFVPDGLAALAVPVALLGVGGILWGGLVCLVEQDLKRLIAFSSVAHMGFVLLGVASGTPEGLQAALFVGVAHGLVTALLFWVVGMIKHRRLAPQAYLNQLPAGLRDSHPRLGWALAFGCAAGLGLPGLAGFWGEILALLGSWRSPDDWLGPVGPWAAFAGIVGTALAAAYLLRVLYLIWHGGTPAVPSPAPVVASVAADMAMAAAPAADGVRPAAVAEPSDDLSRLEIGVVAPLVALTLAIGVQPWLLLSMTGPAVRALVASW